jgi:SAM-dependent methyltransferase
MRKLLTRDLLKPSGTAAFHLALSTFGLLALELALIRWLASQMRVFAYFSNLVLIAAFLGMGLGLGIARRRGHLRHWVLPALLLLTIPAALAEPLGLTSLTFPDLSIHMWGAEGGASEVGRSFADAGELFRSILIVLSLFWGVAATFVLAGVSVGHFFAQMRPLRAYGFDLLGSLLGVLAIGLATWLTTGPMVWFFVACVPFLYLSARWINVACFAGILLTVSTSIDGALFSPYSRIDLASQANGDVLLNVNRDFHQYIHNFSPDRLAAITDPDVRATIEGIRTVYDLPFLVAQSSRRVLVVGAGTGNDAQGALRNGAEEVVAVDIDGTILKLGQVLHPEEPYSDPAVETVTNDGRAYLEQYSGEPFDVVSFGLVDSHALFSAMSSLRLENYIYTREGLQAAWNVLGEDGLLSLSFSVVGGPWVADRLYWTLAEATGREPVMVHHKLHGGTTFLVSKSSVPPNIDRFLGKLEITTPAADVVTTTDDWPFLYIRPGVFPWGYVLLLTAVLLTAILAVRAAYGGDVMGGGFDRPLFFMGAAFLLLETRGVTSLSLLFGSTWVVNSVVFGGILTTVLIANWAVDRLEPTHERRWFIPLFFALAVLWAVPVGALNALPMMARGVLGGLLVGLPVGIAGVIVSIRLRKVPLPTAALGSNLLGAVVGGCLEYLSMWTGLRALVLLAAVFYLLSLVASSGSRPSRSNSRFTAARSVAQTSSRRSM